VPGEASGESYVLGPAETAEEAEWRKTWKLTWHFLTVARHPLLQHRKGAGRSGGDAPEIGPTSEAP